MLDVTRLRVIDAVARLGSVTAAAKELHYTQPTVSHHLARLEAETGAQLLQRAGRGIRLTPAGQLLASRAAEILGRIDAADAELSAHVGLSAGRVRVASFSSVIGSLIPRAVAALTDAVHTARRHLDRRLRPMPHPPAIDVCRPRIRTQDRLHLQRHGRHAGAGRRLGVTTSPGLALRAHRVKGIVASELPESRQHIYAATYGEPPDPPATTALLAALAEVAASIGDVSPTPDA